MQLSDLIAIGRLGNKLDCNGYVILRKNDIFQPEFLSQKDVFLVFPDNRVRYVTITSSENRGNKIFLRFLETEVINDAIEVGSVKLMLAEEDLVQFSDEFWDPVGSQVYSNSKHIGEIVDFMFNRQYMIFNVSLTDKSEIMIPDVPKYIKSKDFQASSIEVKNIDELLINED